MHAALAVELTHAQSACGNSVGAAWGGVQVTAAPPAVRRTGAHRASPPHHAPPPIQVTRGTPKLSSYSRFRLLPRCSPIKVKLFRLRNAQVDHSSHMHDFHMHKSAVRAVGALEAGAPPLYGLSVATSST
jgi:hypothetical protein